MDENDLKTVVSAKITGALGFMGGTLSKERLLAEQYYKGDPLGNEVSGRSQVVSRDVAEAVDSMLPALLKVFSGSDEIVRFEGRRPETEKQAKQSTDYCNWIFFTQNDGFLILHNWFKDALLKKNGVVKCWWDESTDVTKETYNGLTQDELSILEGDDDVEIVSQQERPALTGAPSIGVQPGNPDVPQETVYDVVVNRTKQVGRARIVVVPPNEYLIDHRAVSLDEVPFQCHRVKKTISDLLEMGYDPDVVEDLGSDNAEDFNMEIIERFKDEDAYPYRSDNYVDPSMREVWINECYLKVDYDGDGIAEMRKVVLAGESAFTLLANDEVDGHPFCALTPIPMPHKFYGLSIADQTMDLQQIKTALWRNSLDSVYLGTAPRVGIVDGEVNLDDLLDARPGGVVRMKSPNALVPIPTLDVSESAFTMVQYVDSVKEARTGVRRFSSTLGEDSINPYADGTATAANLVDNASNDRLELIARIFAETGIKQLFRRILELVCKHQNETQIIKLRGQYVTMDPREWTTEMDMSINVGLGTGDRTKQLQHLMGLAPLIQAAGQAAQMMGAQLVSPQNIYNFVAKAIEFASLKSPELYITDPSTQPQGQHQPPPNPQMMKQQADAQALQAKTQAQIQISQMQAQQDAQEQQQRAQTDMQIAGQKAQFQAGIEHQKALANMQIEQLKAQHDMELERQRSANDMRIASIEAAHRAVQPATQPAVNPGAPV